MMIDNKSNPQHPHPYHPQTPHSAAAPTKKLGALKINYIIYFYLPIILLTPAYTYYMAVTNKQ